MAGRDDEADGFDWLAGQFEPTEEVPKAPPGVPPAQPGQVPPAPAFPPTAFAAPPFVPQSFSALPPTPAAAPPAPVPPAAAAPAAPPVAPPVAPPAAPPAAPSAGGFAWGLKPGGSVEVPPPAAAPPTAAPFPAAVPPAAAAPFPAAVPPAAAAPPPAPPSAPTAPFDWTSSPVSPPSSDPGATQRMPWDPPPVAADPNATQAMPWESYVQQAPAVTGPSAATFLPVAPIDPGAPAPSVPLAAGPNGAPPTQATTALDSLFGDTQFREYQEPGLLGVAPGGGLATSDTDSSGATQTERTPLGTPQKVLIWVASGLVAAFVLLGLFLVGIQLGTPAKPAPAVTPSASAEPDPATLVGPVAPGDYGWDKLLGRECLEPFDSPWAENFTVVDCGVDHTGQLLARGELPDDAAAPFPGVDALQATVSGLCTGTEVLNYSNAGKVNDVRLSASFPATDADWAAGNRTWFCFVSRESAKPLPGDLSVEPKS